MAAFALVAGDTGTVLLVTVKKNSDKQPADLTGKTVRLLYRIDGGELVTRTMEILDPPTQGKARYIFVENELTAAPAGTSKFRGEIEVEDGNGMITTQLVPMNLLIRARV